MLDEDQEVTVVWDRGVEAPKQDILQDYLGENYTSFTDSDFVVEPSGEVYHVVGTSNIGYSATYENFDNYKRVVAGAEAEGASLYLETADPDRVVGLIFADLLQEELALREIAGVYELEMPRDVKIGPKGSALGTKEVLQSFNTGTNDSPVKFLTD